MQKQVEQVEEVEDPDWVRCSEVFPKRLKSGMFPEWSGGGPPLMDVSRRDVRANMVDK